MPNQNYAKTLEGLTAWLAAEQPGGGNSWKLGKGSLSTMCAKQTIVGHFLLFSPLHFMFWDRLSLVLAGLLSPPPMGGDHVTQSFHLLMSACFECAHANWNWYWMSSISLRDILWDRLPLWSSQNELGWLASKSQDPPLSQHWGFRCALCGLFKSEFWGLHSSECLHGKHFPQGDIHFLGPFTRSCFLATNELLSLATM